MIVLGTIVTDTNGPKIMAKNLNPALQEALREGVKFWHRTLAPGHFRMGAAGKYGYAKRNRKAYLRRWPEKAGKPDLVFRGILKMQILGSIRVSGTAKLASGRLHGPPYFVRAAARQYVRIALRKRGNATTEYRFVQLPDMGAEVLATVPEEVAKLADVCAALVEIKLKSGTETTTQRI